MTDRITETVRKHEEARRRGTAGPYTSIDLEVHRRCTDAPAFRWRQQMNAIFRDVRRSIAKGHAK